MAMAALSPGSVLASPIQVNPQVKTDLQNSLAQTAQDARKTEKTVQTDTVTISAQALKMADDKNTEANETDNKPDEQESQQAARDKADVTRNEAQRNAVRSYSEVSANQ